MTQKELEKYLADVWEKYAHPDSHGYKDFMYPGGFNDAVREVLQEFGVDVAAHETAAKTLYRALKPSASF